jgi:hypothetical protein
LADVAVGILTAATSGLAVIALLKEKYAKRPAPPYDEVGTALPKAVPANSEKPSARSANKVLMSAQGSSSDAAKNVNSTSQEQEKLTQAIEIAIQHVLASEDTRHALAEKVAAAIKETQASRPADIIEDPSIEGTQSP